MKHFVAYHKIEEWGEYPYPNTGEPFEHFSNKPYSFLEKCIGNRIWVISGERINGKMSYKLVSYFNGEYIDENNTEGYIISGRGIGFEKSIKLFSLSWLDILLKEQGNFRFGINEIKDQRVIDGLSKTIEKRTDSLKIEKDVEIRRKSVDESITDFHYAEEIEHTNGIIEGAKKQIIVNSYERSAKARKLCIEKWGSVCAVCNFNFEKIYGELGKGFIHVHHLKPLSSIGTGYQLNAEKDLRPVCPNCHSMLHRGKQVLTIEELRNILKHSL